MSDLAGYSALFVSALLAATLLPLQSEALLATLLVAGHSPWLLVAAASAGNILGSVLNWWLGRKINQFRNLPWFPISNTALERAGSWFQRYGKWSLLISWMPIVGDPLTLIAGMLRLPFATFLIYVAIAKTGRYVVVAALTSWISHSI